MTIAFSIESFLIALKDTHFLRNTELKAILFYLRNLNYMKSRARLKGGEAILFTIPVSWDVNRITDRNDKERFQAGRLLSGKYRIGLQLEIYMDTEFEVK